LPESHPKQDVQEVSSLMKHNFSMMLIRVFALFVLSSFFVATASAQVLKKIYDFQGGNDGASPASNLQSDGAGGFYGTTVSGGSSNCGGYGCGTFFHLSPPPHSGGAWTETLLYTFQGTPDASQPSGSFVHDQAGNFYGISTLGGSKNWGTVFKLSPPALLGDPWTETVIYSFTDGLDGGTPQGGLVFGLEGALYGTTIYGGANNDSSCEYGCGTAFKLAPPVQTGGAWTQSVIYNFPKLIAAFPSYMTLAADTKGRLYGTTQFLGRRSMGNVFVLLPPAIKGSLWTERDLYSFTGGSDGFWPLAGVILDSSGNIYGTTNETESTLGTVFQLTPPPQGRTVWTFHLLHTFLGSPSDGAHPQTPLSLDKAGNLYGTTFGGGNDSDPNCTAPVGCGVIFELSPSGTGWTESILHEFGVDQDGQRATAPVVLSGSLAYGVTGGGGTTGHGTVFALRP
jgi:uncharacterized repeat protein (TIGR03803 family)